MDDPETPLTTSMPEKPRNPYQITMQSLGGAKYQTDLYRFLDAIPSRSSAIHHAIKKLAFAGTRGSKGVTQDLCEAIASIQEAIYMLEGK